MVKLNDHYFVAWLKVKGYEVVASGEGIYVKIDRKDVASELKEYEKIKPLLKEIRSTVKVLAATYKEK